MHWAGRCTVEEAGDGSTAGAGGSADVRGGAVVVNVIIEEMRVVGFERVVIGRVWGVRVRLKLKG